METYEDLAALPTVDTICHELVRREPPLGVALAAWRKRNAVTLERLASVLDVSPSTVSAAVTRPRRSDGRLVGRIATLIGYGEADPGTPGR
jgi:hypothetical protein